MSNLAAQRPLPLDSSAPNDEGVVALTAPSNSLPKNLAIRRYEAALSHLGPLVVRTGQYTGRLPKDKFLMRLNFSNAAPEQIREGIRCLAAAVKSHLAPRRSFPSAPPRNIPLTIYTLLGIVRGRRGRSKSATNLPSGIGNSRTTSTKASTSQWACSKN